MTPYTPERLWKEYQLGLDFKRQINLFETVKNNENFFIGKQWEGVQANGLPTPVFNFIRRIVLYLVATTAADTIKLNASPLPGDGHTNVAQRQELCTVVNGQFEALFEQNKLSLLTREMMRNAAVDGDGCLYSYFDPLGETGQSARGVIRTQVLENSQVIFGNPNCRQVEGQPYIILTRRERVSTLVHHAKAFGGDGGGIRPDADQLAGHLADPGEGKCTVVHKLWYNPETESIWGVESVQGAIVRPPWDTRQRRYPIVWLPWEFVQNCYHGQAAVTGLIPNQIFVNKLFAMTMISLMTTAYPKVIFDKTRIPRWDARVGAAIGVAGGDMNAVARNLEPATISPQVSQFIQLALSLTKEFMGATDAAMGATRPDNTSAIIALQKASAVPMELIRQNLYQCLEDLGRIWLDLMGVYYGKRYVQGAEGAPALFDFSALVSAPLTLKLDVGGSAYWSEIAQVNTLDNLLAQGKIDIIDYLKRIPNGYISDQEGLISTLEARQEQVQKEETHLG